MSLRMNQALKVSITKGFKNTPLGFVRIRKNLNVTHFSDIETEGYLKEILLSTPLENCFPHNIIYKNEPKTVGSIT